jgi:hypothetical protein
MLAATIVTTFRFNERITMYAEGVIGPSTPRRIFFSDRGGDRRYLSGVYVGTGADQFSVHRSVMGVRILHRKELDCTSGNVRKDYLGPGRDLDYEIEQEAEKRRYDSVRERVLIGDIDGIFSCSIKDPENIPDSFSQEAVDEILKEHIGLRSDWVTKRLLESRITTYLLSLT